MAVQKFADDGFTRALAGMLEDKIGRMKTIVDKGEIVSRATLAKFVYESVKLVRKLINPNKEPLEQKRLDAWRDAKGMLKGIVDFDKFNMMAFNDEAVRRVLEKKVLEVLTNYKSYVETGQVVTKHPPPKLLGETELILCVDKPCNFICNFGSDGGAGKAKEGEAKKKVPHTDDANSATALLNGDQECTQIHQYLALKYHFETAMGTREFWASKEEFLTCNCGYCDYCACTQTGCCNRLDKETSGVMVVAKTKTGFRIVRDQFRSKHSLEAGGTEKYYLALAEGIVKLPTADKVKTPHWSHTVKNGRGRVEVTQRWNGRRSVCYDNGEPPKEDEREYIGASKDPQYALTLYEPVAYLSSGEDKYTLLKLQIITGRRHQIRFHCEQIGHPLVGDETYGASNAGRRWLNRVFLHSYCTKFREPFTDRWFEATSPLPQDLGEALEQLQVDGVVEERREALQLPLFSRRVHKSLESFMVQYTGEDLLIGHDTGPELQSSAATFMQKDERIANEPSLEAPQWTQRNDYKKSSSWDSSNGNGSWWASANNDWKSGGGGWHDKNNGGNKSYDGWSSVKEEVAQSPAATAPAKSSSTAAKESDSDDEWGDWGAAGEKPGASKATPPSPKKAALQDRSARVPQPPPKRLRVDVPPQNVNRVPTTPADPVPPGAGNVAAGWVRKESRSQKGIFYYWNQMTGETDAEPPAPWEKKESRSKAGVFYYWNPSTGATSVEKPEI
eukprot:TRINITY_DN71322_c0_g1_i1.p1 TRINITY_DN71322_c0_g1~~TRINITY_DN71322_c0_g1_i1.p1  ORF type:complete len:730 (-),score=159.68 TRINITY_DN71322_c0_g1_i1:479-2668(-)